MALTRPITLALAAVLAAACGRTDTTKDSTVAVQSASPAAARGKPACPRTGHWNDCGVKLRLVNAGMVLVSSDEIDGLPALGPKPLLYTVGGRDLAVFIFPDAAARGRAMATLDTALFVPSTQSLTPRGETTVIETDNLLALLRSTNDQQRERVSDALQVGPPQP
jgi:hypothetical protein